MKIYVGNLPFSVRDQSLKDLFAPYGEITSASVITDRDSGQSKGFGFVEIASQEGSERAIRELNNKEIEGRNLKVNEAKPREDRPRRQRY